LPDDGAGFGAPDGEVLDEWVVANTSTTNTSSSFGPTLPARTAKVGD
jgi:hypothetical protein